MEGGGGGFLHQTRISRLEEEEEEGSNIFYIHLIWRQICDANGEDVLADNRDWEFQKYGRWSEHAGNAGMRQEKAVKNSEFITLYLHFNRATNSTLDSIQMESQRVCLQLQIQSHVCEYVCVYTNTQRETEA